MSFHNGVLVVYLAISAAWHMKWGVPRITSRSEWVVKWGMLLVFGFSAIVDSWRGDYFAASLEAAIAGVTAYELWMNSPRWRKKLAKIWSRVKDLGHRLVEA